MAACLLCIAGAALAIPQLFTYTPWTGGFALGLFLIVLGGVKLADKGVLDA